ncbi:hypothetical protein BACI71_40103 [Bacillus mycoides]|uniref:Uncharacterized protein n=1 Tax=Bacillus mycoides TaxID=1405 RepID=A0A653ZDI6_BACMY|nr:hypothetical protein BACI71_40103 [Bacillus mycoides]
MRNIFHNLHYNSYKSKLNLSFIEKYGIYIQAFLQIYHQKHYFDNSYKTRKI